MSDLIKERSLINIVLDLIELDPDAPENQDIINTQLASLGDKVEKYCYANNFADSQLELVQNEIERLKAVEKRIKGLKESLKQRAIVAMEMMNVKSIKSDLGHTMTITESHAVEITDLAALPELVKKVKMMVEPDKVKIKEMLKTGETVAGARLVTNKSCRFTKPKKEAGPK